MWREIYHAFRSLAKSCPRPWGTTITVETKQIWILARSRSTHAWCTACGREVDMISLNEVGGLEGNGTPAPATKPLLPGWGGSQGWHWSQASDGTPLICLESLRRATVGQPIRRKEP